LDAFCVYISIDKLTFDKYGRNFYLVNHKLVSVNVIK
jgi:hypothetical protein